MTSLPSTLDHAIVCTLLYGDVFKFPMTAAEIHHFLIGITAKLDEVEHTLNHPSSWLSKRIISDTIDDNRYYAIHTRDANIFTYRRERMQASAILWRKGQRHSRYLGQLPFVQMVALTGSIALQNADDTNDDLDYLLVVQEGRVWLARLFAVILVRICKLWGVTLCPNYVLSSDALAQEPQNLFMAHEITQMVPMMGQDIYQRMRAINAWTATYLPNATHSYYPERDRKPRWIGKWLKRTGEFLLSGLIGNWLEAWEMRRKLRKLSSQMSDSAEVQLDKQRVKGHFIDYGQISLQQYQQRLVAFGLAKTEEHSSAAD